MKVDFYSTADIPDSIKSEYLKKFTNVIDSDSLIEGKACRQFEEEFADYLNVRFCLGVGNGFDALRVALLALGIQPGDRVAVPSHTFIATWYAVLSIGAVPVGIDVDNKGQIDLDLLETETNLKCVIPVHMHGTHCDMQRLMNWAAKFSVFVLEDCAQSAGLIIQGRKAGSWGHVAAFSFYPTKNLFALGDGGAICSNDKTLFETAKSISRYGSSKGSKYQHERLGQNSRLDSIQAGILSINLQHLDEWNSARNRIAGIYLRNIPATFLNQEVAKSHIYHHFVIYSEKRDLLRTDLSSHGIGTEMHYPFLAAHEIETTLINDFTVGERLSQTGLSLPISPWQTDVATNRVVEKLCNFAEKLG